MKIIKGDNFKIELQNILTYIGTFSVTRANKFYIDVMIKVDKLDFMPFSHRESIYYNNENIRNLIFKGYVIPYEINEEKEEIIILDIVNYRIKK